MQLPDLPRPNRTKIINALSCSKELKQFCLNQAIKAGYAEIGDDLYQEMFMIFFRKKSDWMVKKYVSGELNYYIVKLIKNMLTRENDTFYRNYVVPLLSKVDITSIPDFGDNKQDDFFEDALNLLPKYLTIPNDSEFGQWDKNILELYLKHGTNRKIHNVTGYHEKYITNAMKRNREFIKEKISEELEVPEKLFPIVHHKPSKNKTTKDEEIKEAVKRYHTTDILWITDKSGNCYKTTVQEFNKTHKNPYAR